MEGEETNIRHWSTNYSTKWGTVSVVLVGFLLCTMSQPIDADDAFCVLGTAEPPVTLSDYIKVAFTAELYVLDGSTNSGYWMYEHYSALSEKSAVYADWPGYAEEMFFLYDFSTKTGVTNFYVEDCTSTTSENPIGLMGFDATQATYVEQTTVNGEPLHLWRQCVSESSGEYTHELYTTGTKDEWPNPQGLDYQPVLFRRSTKDVDDQVITISYFVTRYDIRDEDDSLARDLEPPLGYTCPTQLELDLPPLPASMIYAAEPGADPRHPETFILDTDKLETLVDRSGPSIFDSQREIDSYDQGLVYIMPYNNYACGILQYAIAMDPTNYDVSASSTYSYNFLSNDAFESVTEFLGMNYNYFTYNGEYTVRGIPCYAYTQFYDDYHANYDKLSLVLFFARADVQLSSVYGTSATLVAKYIYYWAEDGSAEITTEHIYSAAELDYRRLTYDPLDITMCSNGLAGTMEFGLTLESTTGEDITQLTPAEEWEVKDAVRMSLSAAVGIDELRVLASEVSVNGKSVTVLGTLFGGFVDSAVYVTYYGAFPDDYTIPSDDIIDSVTTSTLDDCKDHADDNDDALFGSWCSDSNTCTSYSVYHITELDSYLEDDCSYFGFGVTQTGPLTVEDTWNELVGASVQGIQVLDYKVTSLVPTTPDPSEEDDPAIADYSSVPGRVSASVDTLDNYDLVNCAQACTESLLYNCEQFTYCESTNQCILNPVDANPYIEADSDCNYYTRNYLSEFAAYPGTSGLTGLEYFYEDIEDPNVCAHLCLDMTDFRCESFEYCSLEAGGSGTCSLGTTHYYDADAMSPIDDVACTHYSRSYLGDYERMNGVTNMTIVTQIKDSAPEECAKLCSEEDESGKEPCMMFQFCEDDMLCQLIDSKEITSEALLRNPDLQVSDYCATYSLLDSTQLTHGRSEVSNAASSSSQSGQYGASSMAFLALIMLAVGVGLVFLSLWVQARKPHLLTLGWWRNAVTTTRAKDDMTFTFSKDEDAG